MRCHSLGLLGTTLLLFTGFALKLVWILIIILSGPPFLVTSPHPIGRVFALRAVCTSSPMWKISVEAREREGEGEHVTMNIKIYKTIRGRWWVVGEGEIMGDGSIGVAGRWQRERSSTLSAIQSTARTW